MMSEYKTPTICPQSSPAIVWADLSDSDDDTCEETRPPTSISPIQHANVTPEPASPPQPQEPQTEVHTKAHTANIYSNTDGGSGPARHLDFIADSQFDEEFVSVRKVTRCQEMTVASVVPYKLRSVWTVTGGLPQTNSPDRYHSAQSSVRKAESLRQGRALEEITSVLRANMGSMSYTELMKRTQWRAKFQPCYGSLFAFVKRNNAVLGYNKTIVSLIEAEGIVNELLKVQWW
eukprot:Tbor_TRINITY_DN4594_c0_g1::TRINITY_DN4594_c0_g1_i1::g.15888::m.15888